MINKDHNYGVIETGGSIGSSKHNYIPGKGRLVHTFEDHEEAKDYARIRRSHLSKGERSYYRMSYRTLLITPYMKKLIFK